MRKYVFALLFSVLAVPAWAQCTTLPFTLLPGTTADGGQVMADLNALNFNCGPGLNTGNVFNAVHIYPPGNTFDPAVPWIIGRPDGLAQNCSGTTSSCFNEAEATAYQNGWSVYVHGCGEYQGEGAAPPHCALAVNTGGGFIVNPLANRSLILDGVQMQCIGGANQGCMNIDSMMKGYIGCNGCEIVSGPTTGDSAAQCAWKFRPTNPIPNEGVIGIQDSMMYLGNFGVQPQSGTAHSAMCIDLRNGGFNHSLVFMNEANTGGPGSIALGNYDIIVENSGLINPACVGGFGGNQFTVGHAHFAKLASIKIGDDLCHAFYGQGIWKVGAIHPGFAGSTGIDTFGSFDQFEVGNILNSEGPMLWGIQAEAHANNNTFSVGAMAGAASASGNNPGVNDLSGWLNNYRINGKPFSVLGPLGQVLSGIAPTVSFGTGGSVSTTSTAYQGTLIAGTGSPTSATITLPITLNFVYSGCVGVSTRSTSNPVTTGPTLNTTQVQFTLAGAATAADLLFYQCW